jgi:nanoRNase/pAp phosphatase (c-di-AMP/oligoRNAs hydrolase)
VLYNEARKFVKKNPSHLKVSTAERLRRLRELFSPDERVLIVIDADPDSIASALAFKRLLWRKVAQVTIARINEIKRGDNLCMIDLLEVPLVPAAEVDPAAFSRTVMLDSQPQHKAEFARFQPEVIIDHHPLTGGGPQASFVDIRPDYGAAATIMTEYLRSARIVPSVRVATALFYAIKSDTRGFERKAGEEDMRAFRYLFSHADKGMVRKIELSEMPASLLPSFQAALANLHISRGWAFAHLGEVPNPDALVLVADFLIRIQEVSWSAVSGVAGGSLVVVVRNDGYHKNAGRVVAAAFGSLGTAGGKRESARAEIPLAALEAHLLDTSQTSFERFIWSGLRAAAGKPE